MAAVPSAAVEAGLGRAGHADHGDVEERRRVAQEGGQLVERDVIAVDDDDADRAGLLGGRALVDERTDAALDDAIEFAGRVP